MTICDYCDGCGWTEGGETLQTVCVKCAGTGSSSTPPSPTQETPAKIRTESLREHKRNCALNRGVGPPWVCTCKSVPEETPAELTESLDELRDADAAYFGWTPTTSPPDWADDIKPLEDRVIAARSALVSLYTRQREEIAAMRTMYAQVCDPLQDYCQRHKLGLGGEMVHELVIEELERLKADSERLDWIESALRNGRTFSLFWLKRERSMPDEAFYDVPEGYYMDDENGPWSSIRAAIDAATEYREAIDGAVKESAND